MNGYLLLAGSLAILLGLVHSVLGETFVFQKLRDRQSHAWLTRINELPIRSIRILWASWHVVTVFGCGFGLMMIWLAYATTQDSIAALLKILFVTIFISALVVLVGTKGRHPGWFVLLIISSLILAS